VSIPIHLHELIQTYGYPAAFIGPIIEGEIFLMLAGLAAHRGHLDLGLLWVLAAAGAIVGDIVYFTIGRTFGARVLDRWPHFAPAVARAQHLVEKKPALAVIGLRFLYGMRIAGPIVIGSSRINTFRYLTFDAVGALAWSGLWLGVGYMFGEAAQRMVGNLKHIEHEVFGALLLGGLAFFIIRWLMKRRKSHRVS
jgi:membrane protein DedA with SNARE-associated domain